MLCSIYYILYMICDIYYIHICIWSLHPHKTYLSSFYLRCCTTVTNIMRPRSEWIQTKHKLGRDLSKSRWEDVVERLSQDFQDCQLFSKTQRNQHTFICFLVFLCIFIFSLFSNFPGGFQFSNYLEQLGSPSPSTQLLQIIEKLENLRKIRKTEKWKRKGKLENI